MNIIDKIKENAKIIVHCDRFETIKQIPSTQGPYPPRISLGKNNEL